MALFGGQPWYDAAVRALSDEEMSTERGELTWITSFDPAWPKYFADPDSPRAAPLDWLVLPLRQAD